MLVDCALLTDRGIAFVLIPEKTMRVFQQRVVKNPNAAFEVTVETDSQTYKVDAKHILVKLGGERVG